MLDNTITLAVDELNNASTTDHEYTRYDEYQNRSLYNGPDNTLSEREILGFYRTTPSKSGNFKGVAKSSFKFTKDISVEGVDSTSAVTAPMITTVSFSIPIGATPAEVMVERQKAIALCDDDSIMARLNDDLEI
jgi:hypothetical protein